MIVSFFHMTPAEVRATPGLHQRLRYMGVRHLEMQVYRSPQHDPDYPTWEREWERLIGSEIDWCVKEGWEIVGRMDDGFRTQPECEALRKMPETLTHVSARLRDSGRCDRVEVCDEMKQDPSVYPLDVLVQHWHVGSGPKIVYPGAAVQRLEKLYEVGGYSRQWNWWTCRNQRDRLARLRGSLIDVPRDGREVCAMIPVAGMYRKGGPGNEKSRKDKWLCKPPTVKDVEEMFDLAREMGATRFRLYAWDGAEWKRNRMVAPEGAELQTGLGLTDGRWDGAEMVIKKLLMERPCQSVPRST